MRSSQCGDFGDPCPDQQAQPGRQQAERKQPAPADIGFDMLSEYRAKETPGKHRSCHAGDPAALGGRHELLHYGDVDGIETGDAKADEEPARH